jgi:GH18 family chitinase
MNPVGIRTAFALLLISIGQPVCAQNRASTADPAGAPAEKPPFLCVGYLPWYRTAGFTADRMRGVTDLIYFGVKPTHDGRLDDEKVDAPTLRLLGSLRRESGCRLLLCVGGGERSQGFPPMATDAARRRAFVRQLTDYCREHGFSGVDYDWEHPEGDAQLAAYADLLEETKSRLGADGLVTIAQSPWRDYGRRIYEIVDRVHVMSYNHKFPHGRLQAAEDDVQRMVDFGCPREKLLLGLPFYGRNQRGESRTYADLANTDSPVAGNDLVRGYALNGKATVQAKTRFAIDSGLGGVMVWELGQDARDPELSLLETIRREVDETARP